MPPCHRDGFSPDERRAGSALKLPTDLAEADRLTPYAAAIRYGLGDPGAVPTSDALRWAALAIEWTESELRSDS